MKTLDMLTNEFIECIRERRGVDYANRISVAKYNALAKRSTKIAQLINENYHHQIDRFLALLDCDEWDIRVACAVYAIQNLSCTKEQRQKAIDLIRKYITEEADSIEASAFTMNLKEWETDAISD